MHGLTDPLVELRNLTFGYGERVILDNISLTIPRGKVTALMGASAGNTVRKKANSCLPLVMAVPLPLKTSAS